MAKRLGGVKMTVKMGASEGTYLNFPLVYVLLDLKPDKNPNVPKNMRAS